MKSLTQKEIAAFQKKILSWFANNKRDLPWRRTRDPYKILVSEVMLQQTQVARVIPKYEAWLAAFPTVKSLAKASTSEVLRFWSGLGYNRRALYLQKAAKEIVEKYNGIVPNDSNVLETLPGIGKYTSRAVACFAFDAQIAVVDTNIRRVILTQFSMKNEKDIQRIADLLLPKGKAYEWNQALMDYASLMLKHEKIPTPKQSQFKGSNRYYRGQIIKLLIKKKRIVISDTAELLEIEDHMLLEIILEGLMRDGLICKSKTHIRLAR